MLDKLAGHNFENTTPELRDNILAYYRNPSAPIATKRDAAAWQKTQDELQRLKEAVNPESSPSKASRSE